jgi:hypothetical protein
MKIEAVFEVDSLHATRYSFVEVRGQLVNKVRAEDKPFISGVSTVTLHVPLDNGKSPVHLGQKLRVTIDDEL